MTGIKLAIIAILCAMILGYCNKSEASNRDIIREARIKACEEGYERNKKRVNEIYLHKEQDPITRCATFMTLVYAYESWFGKSRRCMEDFNCFWIKQTTFNTWIPATIWDNRFKIYRNYDDWNRDFAILYFRFHFNKNIEEFVNSRSLTDRETYIDFKRKRFLSLYNDLKKLWKN